MVATVVQFTPRRMPAPTPAERPDIVRQMAVELIAHQVDLSDEHGDDAVVCLINARWRWRDIKPHIDDAIQEAKQIILMREMGLEACQK